VPKLLLELRGAQIKGRQIPIDILGQSLIGLNKLLKHITMATERIPKKSGMKKKFFKSRQFYMARIEKGSAVVVLQTEPQTVLGEMADPVISLLHKVFDGFENIQLPEEEEAYKKIHDMFPKVDDRIRILNDYKFLWKIPDVEITIKSTDNAVKRRVELQHSYRNRISAWLNRELEKTPQIIKGIITRVKADGPRRYFTIFDEKNNHIECEFNRDLENKIIELFKVPIKLKGIITQIRTKRKVKEVLEIEKLDFIKITNSDYNALVTPIEFDLEFDTNLELWVAENEELGIRSAAESLDELREEIILMLDFMVDKYLIQKPTEKLSPKLQQAIDELKKVVDPSKRTIEDHWELIKSEK